jgi:hypothetical protein
VHGVTAFGTEAAADANLAGTLHHGGQHDTHGVDAAHHHVEDALGLLTPAEQLDGDDDLGIPCCSSSGPTACIRYVEPRIAELVADALLLGPW